MKIEVLGNCCATCRAVFAAVKAAANEVDPKIEVQQIEDIMTILRYHVVQTPAVVIDGEVVSMGYHLSKEDAKQLIESHLKTV